MGIWTRKDLTTLESIDNQPGETGGLAMRRVLGRFDLILIGVGSTIGAGIFVITGTAAAQYAGPAIVLSFIISGFACLCTGFCYAELASMMPVAGSSYTYAYASLGELIAWNIGWCLVLEYTVAGSTIAVGWAGYFTNAMAALGWTIPTSVSSATITVNAAHQFILSGALLNVPAVAIVLAMTMLLVVGIKESAVANAIFVMIKLGVILLTVFFGSFYVHPENWHPFIPPNTGEFGTYGWCGILHGAGEIFFAYIGFETVSTCAFETRNPQRDLGFSILVASLICTVLYVAMALVMTGLAPYKLLNVDDPIMVALDHGGRHIAWLKPCVSAAAIVGLASTILMSVYGQSRIFYTMAQDGLLPKFFAHLHVRFQTPGAPLSGQPKQRFRLFNGSETMVPAAMPRQLQYRCVQVQIKWTREHLLSCAKYRAHVSDRCLSRRAAKSISSLALVGPRWPMVMIVDTSTLAKLLRHVGLETFLAELADRIERDFVRWPQFEKSARTASYSAAGVLELMPTADSEWFSFKLVNGHPSNPAQGLLTVTAVGMLADVATGYARLVSEMTVLTALRTAATSAMVARRLANRGATTMALIGTGAQGEFQALAFKACVGIRAVRYHDIDPSAMRKFAHNLAGSGLDLIPCSNVAETLTGAEIITTATAVKDRCSVLTNSLIGPGVHINAIGGDCPGKTELDPALLARANVFVEYLPQTRIEGDIQSLGPEAPATEIWQVLAGLKPGRIDRQQLTIFDSVGFALEDYSALRYVYDKVLALGIATDAHLVPAPHDPKDLFGYIMASDA